MADPRLFTVKQCQPAYASNSGAQIGNATSSRRDFFNAVGKIGDLQVLNSVGGGTIGQGLRNLASVSNSIRMGTGSLPTSIGSTLDSGANWVLGQTGIAPTVVDAVRGFNPGIANQAYGQATSIFQRVKQGGYKTSDIPNSLQDLQNLERLGRNIYTPGNSDVQNQLTERCDASPYAIDLIARAPKYKFLFIVQFVPDNGYEAMGRDYGPLDMAFTVKKSSRPNVRFQMDDVNYYNYRTKVVTKTEFEEMNMSFHDDQQNIATEFYQAYLRAMSPITGIFPTSSATDPSILEQRGMDFQGNTLVGGDAGQIPVNFYAGSTGPLANNVKQVFREIRIYHLFDYGNLMNVYRFANPRISHLQLDDLDMSIGSEGSEISLSFVYDSLYLDTNVDVGSTKRYNIGQLQRGGVYPIRYNGTSRSGSSQTTITALDGITNGLAGSTIRGLIADNPISTITNGVSGTINSAASAAVAAADDLSQKFSNPFSGLPLNA